MSVEPRPFADVDQNVAINLRGQRERMGLSQEELAQRMTDRGFGFSQATIWKIEQGKRPLKFSEMVGLRDALDLPSWFPFETVSWEFTIQADLREVTRRAEAAYNAVVEAATQYQRVQRDLANIINSARDRKVVLPEGTELLLRQPAEWAAIQARVDDHYRMDHETQIEDHFFRVVDALNQNGLDPFVDPGDYGPIPISSPPPSTITIPPDPEAAPGES